MCGWERVEENAAFLLEFTTLLGQEAGSFKEAIGRRRWASRSTPQTLPPCWRCEMVTDEQVSPLGWMVYLTQKHVRIAGRRDTLRANSWLILWDLRVPFVRQVSGTRQVSFRAYDHFFVYVYLFFTKCGRHPSGYRERRMAGNRPTKRKLWKFKKSWLGAGFLHQTRWKTVSTSLKVRPRT